MSIVKGLCLDLAWQSAIPWFQNGRLWRMAAPIILYSAIFLAFPRSPFMDLRRYLGQLPLREEQFDSEVSLLASQPDLAICESVLRCFYAGKSFVYDPFNSTTLVKLGKLDSQEIIRQITEKRFGAIQTSLPVAEMGRPSERFPDEILTAIDCYYEVWQRRPDCVLCVPRPYSTDVQRH